MNNDLSKIKMLFEQKKFAEAEALVWHELRNKPEDFILNKTLGVLLIAQEKFTGATKTFSKCYLINNKDFDIVNNLSFCLLKCQEFEFASHYAIEANKLNNKRFEPLFNIAEALLLTNQFELAYQNIIQGIELLGGIEKLAEGAYYEVLINYFDILLALNKEEELIEKSKAFLKINPKPIVVRYLLGLKIEYVDDNIINHLKNDLESEESFFQKTPSAFDLEKIDRLITLNFLFARYYAQSDHEKSEAYYVRGNTLLGKIQRISPLSEQKKYIDIINFFNKLDISNYTIPKDKGSGIIFIIGMPRSGTSLLESIFASSDAVFAGGERFFFSAQVNNKLDTGSLDTIDEKFFLELGDNYLRSIKFGMGKKIFFTDKLPGNYRNLGFMQIALPGAKFIHSYRDPWDNAISLYKELYAKNISYATKFFNIAIEYANHENIVKFYKQILNLGDETIMELNYSDLVKNTDEYAKKVWDFCELPGFYDPESRGKFFVNTASKGQVRQKIYKSSLNKKDFADQKDSFMAALEDQRRFWHKKMLK